MTFSSTFGTTLQELAARTHASAPLRRPCSPAPAWTGFAGAYPERFFDVGIAEGHAVAMAAGLAKQGMIPVVAVYSTFLQRAFDMLLHDVGLLQLHVVFAVDRAGLVGEDGETHHGVFDVGYLQQVPGMQVLCPANQAELRTHAATGRSGNDRPGGRPLSPRRRRIFKVRLLPSPCLREGDRHYTGVLRHHDQLRCWRRRYR